MQKKGGISEVGTKTMPMYPNKFKPVDKRSYALKSCRTKNIL